MNNTLAKTKYASTMENTDLQIKIFLKHILIKELQILLKVSMKIDIKNSNKKEFNNSKKRISIVVFVCAIMRAYMMKE